MPKTKDKTAMKAVVVKFNEDSVSALYLDGKLAYTNDDYHHSSSETLESFVDGVRWAGKQVGPMEHLHVEGDGDDFPSNDGSNIPEKWPDGKFSETL